MMQHPYNLKHNNVFWSLLLILAGLLFLLQSLGGAGKLSGVIWALLLGAGGLGFLYLFLTNRLSMWWAAIPGCTLLGLAFTALSDQFMPRVMAQLSGSIFLGSLALGFALVYLAQPAHWWATIPAGVMLTLAVIAGAGSWGYEGMLSGTILFVGLGLTFAVVALLPRPEKRQRRWAFIPAAVLLLMGILLSTPYLWLINYIGAFALIVAGFVVLWQSLKAKPRG